MNKENVALDKSVPIALYFQLKNWLLAEIKKENYPVGSCIPAENRLSEMFQVSRTTVRQAINELIRDGWLYRNSTKGTVVTRPKRTSTNVRSMEPFNTQVLRSGQVPRTEVRDLKIINASEELAEILKINPGDKVIYMLRRRFADEVAIVTIQNYLSYKKCSFILDVDFVTASLYETLGSRDETRTHGVCQVVEAQSPTPEDMALLDISNTTPILSFTCLDRNIQDEVISYNLLRYRGDYVKFEVDVVEGRMDRNYYNPGSV